MVEKIRLVVMNGSSIVQIGNDKGAWNSSKVFKADELEGGIYNLFSAKPAEAQKSHLGRIVYVDERGVYQAIDNKKDKLVKHERSVFGDVNTPQIGSILKIAYTQEGLIQDISKAEIAHANTKKLSR